MRCLFRGTISSAKLFLLRLGLEFTSSLLPYGDRWRLHRRLFHERLGKDGLLPYHRVVYEKVHIFLGEFLHDSASLEGRCKWYYHSRPLLGDCPSDFLILRLASSA